MWLLPVPDFKLGSEVCMICPLKIWIDVLYNFWFANSLTAFGGNIMLYVSELTCKKAFYCH